MTKRRKQGKPVLPAIIKKVPISKGKLAVWKDIMESGVSVKPKSLNMDAGVKTPLIELAHKLALQDLMRELTTRQDSGQHLRQWICTCRLR